MNINFICRPVSYFVYALSFPLLPVITALTLTLCTVFITHTNSIYGALHCALLLMNTATALRVSLSVQAFAPIHCCPAAGSLRSRRVGEAFLKLLSELSNFIRNHLHLKVPMEFDVSDIARCINDIPKYLVVTSLNDVSVTRFRASPQLCATGPHRPQYIFVERQLIVCRQDRSSSHEPIHFLVF